MMGKWCHIYIWQSSKKKITVTQSQSLQPEVNKIITFAISEKYVYKYELLCSSGFPVSSVQYCHVLEYVSRYVIWRIYIVPFKDLYCICNYIVIITIITDLLIFILCMRHPLWSRNSCTQILEIEELYIWGRKIQEL